MQNSRVLIIQEAHLQLNQVELHTLLYRNNILRLLTRKDINHEVWDRLVESSSVENYILYSWAMDATTENWCAIVDVEYDFFLPIPFSVKLGVKRARQQVYSRQVDCIGDSKLFPKAIEILKTEFKEFDVRFSENQFGISDQYFQLLDLTKEIDYSKNAKRLIKKAKHLRYELTTDLAPLMELYTSNTHKKLNNSNDHLPRLKRLMESCLENGKGYAFNAFDGDKIVGACFIIEDKSTSTYLIGDADRDEKKAGVVYGMMDFAINTAKEKNMKHFDFGGSNVASVAQFYRKFGAEDKKYTRVNWDKSPFWFKVLKKIKG
jgi:hypothetical protein